MLFVVSCYPSNQKPKHLKMRGQNKRKNMTQIKNYFFADQRGSDFRKGPQQWWGEEGGETWRRSRFWVGKARSGRVKVGAAATRGGGPWDSKGTDPIQRRKGKRRGESKAEVGAALLLGGSKGKRVRRSKTENKVINKHSQTFLNTGPGWGLGFGTYLYLPVYT